MRRTTQYTSRQGSEAVSGERIVIAVVVACGLRYTVTQHVPGLVVGAGAFLMLAFFFFQAEDGIRDLIVTGVQTCALPISAQRSGVLASLNMVAESLKLLPKDADTTKRWSAAAWANERKGWLFLTSTPATRERLVPLTSLWLDTLVLRLMNHGQTGPHPVWFVLDELASLQRLPQLHTAVTENRKSNNPVVLGFQGRSQLETRYGHEAEAMLSQPATKIFLATSEPNAARWISDAIGEIETERLTDSRSSGQWGRSRNSDTQNLQRQREPLVIPSEITGLQPLHGYLKHRNLVVGMSFSIVELPDSHPSFIQRPMEMPRKEERKTAAAAAGANSNLEKKLASQGGEQCPEQELRRNRAEPGHFFR